ncbi:MAG: thiopurine S-methyltransferase [Pseudomonadota bacterium]|nr:thiopurine S-methyltransferase [Pseudomonadota bacterium]
MDTSFWLERWANNQIGWHEQDFNPLLTAHFAALELPKNARVFVPLCGKTRDIAWLLQQGYRVAGIELSELAVQQLFNELGIKPAITSSGKLQRYTAEGIDIYTGDIFHLDAQQLGPIDATYDRAALVALPPDMRARYAPHLMSLTHNAPQLLISFDYDQNLYAGPPHSVQAPELWQLYVAWYRLELLAAPAVPGGVKGLAPAHEMVWHLLPRT